MCRDTSLMASAKLLTGIGVGTCLTEGQATEALASVISDYVNT